MFGSCTPRKKNLNGKCGIREIKLLIVRHVNSKAYLDCNKKRVFLDGEAILLYTLRVYTKNYNTRPGVIFCLIFRCFKKGTAFQEIKNRC